MLATVNISQALAIDGWMSEQELVWLAEQASKHRCIVEIGSYLGRSTRALLDNTGGIVYACDDWKGPRDVYMEKAERKQLLSIFCENMQPHIKKSKLQVIVGDHRDIALPFFPDMVFIDGSHEYQDIKLDIEYWKERLTSGGLLCGHDGGKYEVDAAVDAVLGDVEVAANTTIWYKELR